MGRISVQFSESIFWTWLSISLVQAVPMLLRLRVGITSSSAISEEINVRFARNSLLNSYSKQILTVFFKFFISDDIAYNPFCIFCF